MISNVTYDSSREEMARLLTVFHEEAARMTREQWQINGFSKADEFKRFLHEQPLVDLACMEAATDGDVAMLEDFRKQYGEALLMVIADGTMSPMKYLKPSIMPGSLLLRPADPIQLCQVVRDFIRAYLEKLGREDVRDAFVVESRDGRLRVPYDQISYFESREKKIFLRAGHKEYGFYDTMDHLSQILPEDFIRCHRSFIINRKKIEKVVLSQNTVAMADGLMVPVSRSYRADVRRIWEKET
ncbi:MAG TPA: LytTR family transcriptional regulator DNA-binding domain-containing protein [Candidatus Scybalocola faecavium]|nr:LytTR family transcriptional regulator DNA-binding domain-containing protein [Candidatus Scybalocola faecavium]